MSNEQVTQAALRIAEADYELMDFARPVWNREDWTGDTILLSEDDKVRYTAYAIAALTQPAVVGGGGKESLEEFLALADKEGFSDHYVGGVIRYNREHFFNHVRTFKGTDNGQ